MKIGKMTALVLVVFLSMTGALSQPMSVWAAPGEPSASVSYQTHVQNIGWQGVVKDGATSGTTGRSLRLEAIKINITSSEDLSVSYGTHIQQLGWVNNVHDGEVSGTEGRSYRLEAISIELNGTDSYKYDIYYRVHCQDYGWLGWASNGAYAGTSGESKRLEAIEIKIIKRGDVVPEDTKRSFVSDFASLSYQVYVQNRGWTPLVGDGSTAGSVGQGLYLESLRIYCNNESVPGSILYNVGFTVLDWGYFSHGRAAGEGPGPGRNRIETVQINTIDPEYDIYYRVHVEQIGWLDWAKNNEDAGTIGKNLGIEAIEIVLVKKGAPAPGKTEKPCVGTFLEWVDSRD